MEQDKAYENSLGADKEKINEGVVRTIFLLSLRLSPTTYIQ